MVLHLHAHVYIYWLEGVPQCQPSLPSLLVSSSSSFLSLLLYNLTFSLSSTTATLSGLDAPSLRLPGWRPYTTMPCRTVLHKHKGSSASAACKELGLSTLTSRRKLHLAVTMFNCMSSKSSPYLFQYFSLPLSHYNTHSALSSQLNLSPN